MTWRSFFSKLFGGDEDETRRFSDEEIEGRAGEEEPEEERRGFTVERAAEIIDGLPPDVPRESALRIVRRTLTAAGVEVEDIERATRARESKHDHDIERARSRQEDLRERTGEVVRSLEEEIRKVREDRDTGIAEEEEKVSRALVGLEEVRRIRTFFGFPEPEEEKVAGTAGDPSDEETQRLEPFDPDETQVIRRPGSLSDAEEPAEGGSSTRGARYGTTDER